MTFCLAFSFAQAKDFRLNRKIVDELSILEYFWDEDPGIGKGSQISIPKEAEINTTLDISTKSLSQGIHFLGVRLKTKDGQWSPTLTSIVYVHTPNTVGDHNLLTAIEYFFDDDLGFGKNIVQKIETTGGDKQMAFEISIPQALTVGTHIMGVRTQTQRGQWSGTQLSPIAIFSNQSTATISRVEFFTATDPGLGLGNNLAFTSENGGKEVSIDVNQKLSFKTVGTSSFYFRAKDSDNRWSANYFVPMTITSDTVAPPKISANKLTVCPYGEVILTAKECNGTVKWSSDVTGVSIIVKPETKTTYTATCEERGKISLPSSPLIININPAPSVKVDASKSGKYLEKQTIELSASGGVTYRWTGPNNYSSSQQNPQIVDAKVSNSGVYSVTISNTEGCTATATINILVETIILPPVITANKLIVCQGDDVLLTASGCIGIVKWSTNATGLSIVVKIESKTTYSATCEVGSRASEFSQLLTITTNPIPNVTASASNNGNYYESQNIDLSASGGIAYKWTGPNNFASTQQNPQILNSKAGNSGVYVVTAANADACTASNSVNVKVSILTATEEDPNSSEIQVEVSPNPTQEICKVKIDLLKPAKVSLQLRDISGKSLQEQKLTNSDKHHETTLDFSKYPNGVYLLQVVVDGKNLVKKVAKE